MRMLILLMLVLSLVNCTKTENNPPAVPAVSIEGITVEEGNSDRPVFIRLRLSTASTNTVTAYIKTYDGSAKANEDYKPIDQAPVVFSPGTLINEFKLDLYGDENYEPDESFSVKIESVEGATIGTGETSVVLLNDDAGGSDIVIPSTGYTTPESYAGMQLIWQDEFSGAELNPDYWTFEIGTGSNGWGNNESQYYRKENTTLYNGNLVIEARKEVFSGSAYTSSRMITKNKFDFKYGRVDIRAALPYGQGIWPALWMLGGNISSVGWPACGEVDIMELIGHQPATVYGTAHWSNAGQHAQYGGNKSLLSGTFNDAFHVFSLVWNANQLQWLLDDQVYHSMDITPAELSEFHQNFFFIFNVAVGGLWPGYPDATTVFPQRMIVDYIRVFQQN
ncbi:MAG: family 16 glycosylhydrolase [Lewinellaceae bacterium]|nr:family 16 glycosylhydrolase [Lewinellaceae bacterium]